MRMIDADALEDITVTIDGTVFVRYEDIMNEPTFSKGLPPTTEISVAVGVTDGERHWQLYHTWENEPKPLTIEPKTGRWIPHPNNREWDVCSACQTGCKRREYGIEHGKEYVTEYNYPYCPSCGARMEK